MKWNKKEVHWAIGIFHWTISLSSIWFVTAVSICIKIACKILAVLISTPKDIIKLTLKLHVVQFLFRQNWVREIREILSKRKQSLRFFFPILSSEFFYFFYLCRKTDGIDLLITKPCSDTKHYYNFNTMWLWAVTLP